MAPEPEVSTDKISGEAPSVETSVGGAFEIGQVIADGWGAIAGEKVFLWKMVGLYFGVLFGIGILQSLVAGPPEAPSALGTVLGLLSGVVSALLMTGLLFAVVRWRRGEGVTPFDIFDGTQRWFPVLVTALGMWILMGLGFFLFILPGVYLAVAYLFAPPLVLDKGIGPWEALELSRKTVTQHWFRYFFLYLFLTVIVMVSAIPFGIGLIWTIPLYLAVYGRLYTEAFPENPQ